MHVLTGTLDLSSSYLTKVKSEKLDLFKSYASPGNFCLWTHIRGDLGSEGTSIRVFWEGCYTESSATYVTPTGTPDIRSAGTSVSGTSGTDASSFEPNIFPFIRIVALHDSPSATNSAYLDYALIVG